MQHEVNEAVKRLNSKKTADMDGIPRHIVKLIAERRLKILLKT